MKIIVQTEPGSRRITLDVEASDTISSVKAKISEKQSRHLRARNLVGRGEILEDERTLADYDIREGELLLVNFSWHGEEEDAKAANSLGTSEGHSQTD